VLDLAGSTEPEVGPAGSPIPLLPYEDHPVRQAHDVLHWVSIYQELRSLLATLPVRSAEEAERRLPVRDHVEARLAHWRSRYWEMSGLEGLIVDRQLRAAGGGISLSPRECELLGFLAAHANQFWTCQVLMARAWGDSRLPNEQVRNYIGRLRAKLKAAGAPCRIYSRRSRGYGLVVDPQPHTLVSVVSSVVTLARLRSSS
jgi:Transcriptional regulatory protein, C terminal